MVNSLSPGRTPVSTDDFVAVQRLIHRYCDAVVHRDADLWANCWADEARWDLGRGRLVEGKEAIVSLWRSAMAGMVAVVQMAHNGDAWHTDEDLDRASGKWYIDERMHRTSGETGILLAHYDDDYVRDASNGWQFSRRFLQPHYQGAADLSAPFLNTAERFAEVAESIESAGA